MFFLFLCIYFNRKLPATFELNARLRLFANVSTFAVAVMVADVVVVVVVVVFVVALVAAIVY